MARHVQLALALCVLASPACSQKPTETDPPPGGEGGAGGSGGAAMVEPTRVRVAHFNLREMDTAKLMNDADEQATAAAEIIARFAPDIVNINELQCDIQGTPTVGSPGAPPNTGYGGYNPPGADNALRLASRVTAAGGPSYEHLLLTVGNSGFYWEGTTFGQYFYELRGWGEFRGRFNTAILSRYPILVDQVRVITNVAWADIPDNKIAQMKAETGIDVPPGFPLFEKSLNVVPVEVGEQVVHLVLLHPVAPAFDPINTYRNYDELRGLRLFLDGQLPGVDPLPADAKFIIIGDLNSDPDSGDGDSLPGAIEQVLEHPNVVSSFPAGAGTKGQNGQYNSYLSGCGRDDGTTVDNPASKYQLQLDYLLPSTHIGEPLESLLFWPDHVSERDDFDLACRASDHRFMYMDVML